MGGRTRQSRRVGEPEAAIQRYLCTMAARLAGCSQALAAIGGLVRDPQPQDEGWRRSLALHGARLAALQEEMAGVKGVPADLRQVHLGILEAGGEVVEAVACLTGSAHGGGSCDTEETAGLIAQGGERLSKSADKMLEYLSGLTKAESHARRRPG